MRRARARLQALQNRLRRSRSIVGTDHLKRECNPRLPQSGKKIEAAQASTVKQKSPEAEEVKVQASIVS